MLATLSLSTRAADWIGPAEPGDRYTARSLERMLAEEPLAAGENIRARTLFENARTRHVLVQVRDREPLHYHADSDISVLVLRGRGTIRVADRSLPARSGDMLFIPRGVVHAYINDGPDAGAALVIYSPAPGAADRVLVPDADRTKETVNRQGRQDRQ